MWVLKKSRGGFVNRHPGLPCPSSPAGLEFLGASLPKGERANYVLLRRVMESLVATSPSGGKRSEDVYCGLVDRAEGFAGCQSSQKGAWITVGTQCIDLSVAVAAVAQISPKLLAWLMSRGPSDAQIGLEGSRGSMFRFVGFDYPGDHQSYESDDDVWGAELASPVMVQDAFSMVRWVVGHEVSHLLQGDGGKPDRALRSARASECARILGPLWPKSNLHQMELIADYGALKYLGASATDSDQLFATMRGSLLATLAVCFEGWFVDESSLSESHPSPFLRAEALIGLWADFLDHQVKEGGPATTKYDPGALRRVVDAQILIGWVAGRYGSHRAGLEGLISDAEEVSGLLLGILAGQRQSVSRSQIPAGH